MTDNQFNNTLQSFYDRLSESDKALARYDLITFGTYNLQEQADGSVTRIDPRMMINDTR